MKKYSSLWTVILLALLVLCAAPWAYAQKITGDIAGTVLDPTGAAIPGASVTAENLATRLTRTATTSDTGDFRLAELPVGLYKVSASAQGFKTTVRDVQVAVGSITHADFTLQLGERTDTVVVEAATPLVELSDKLNNYVDPNRIIDLPLNGRDFNSLLGITPGVQRVPGGGFLAVNISGARRTANNYMVDGIPNNDRYYGDSVLNQTGVVGIPATLVPMDAIAEFTVQQTPAAEFGVKGGAAINVIMKSGTNDLHGSAYYFRHDDWTDARNFFAAEKTPLRNQQFGATMGGPIVKDKTFFFGYYEAQRYATLAPYEARIPTQSLVNRARARIAAAGLTPVKGGESLLSFYPISPITDPAVEFEDIGVTIPNTANMNSFSIKLDHRIGEKQQLSGRYFFGDSLQSAPAFTGTLAPPAPNPPDMFNSVAPSRAQLLGVVWTINPTPTKIFETRFGYSRFSQIITVNNDIDPKDLGIDTGPLDAADFGVPAVYYLADFGYIGGVGGYPITTRPNASMDFSHSFTWVRGQHTLKFGGNYQYAFTDSLRNRARTVFDISGATGDREDAIVALLLGRFDDAGRTFGTTRRHIWQQSAGFYLTDDWKIHPRLSLSFGLRYEVSGALNETDLFGANFFPGRGFVSLGPQLERLYDLDLNNFGPRAGFAWDIFGNGKTALRGGYSLTYDIANFGSIHAPRTSFVGGSRAGLYTQITQGVFPKFLAGDLEVLPDDPSATCVDPVTGVGNFVCVLPGVPIFGTSPTGDPPFNAFSVVSPLRTPMYHYFNLTLQHELFRDNVVTVSYVGSLGRNLLLYHDINAPPVGCNLTPTGCIRPFESGFPELAHIIQLTNDSKSWYNSMQVGYRQRNWHGINTQYNLTWGKCTDYNSINRGSRSNFPQLNNPYDPANNKGLCDHDVTLNFNVGGTYGIPKVGALGRMGEGWELGTVFTGISGRPFTPNLGSRDRSGQDVRSIRADCAAGQAPRYDTRNPDQYVANPEIFSQPATGAVGTCGRNILRGPGLAQWDLSLIKTTRLTERWKLQFRWEIFNLLNRANFGLVANNIRFGSFGKISSTPDVDAFNPVISQGGPRNMQFVLKLIF